MNTSPNRLDGIDGFDDLGRQHCPVGPQGRLQTLSRLMAGASLALSMLMLSACGGGGGSSASNGPGVGGTGAAAGPVTGFGSIIVNNSIRFDDTGITALDDDGASSTVKLGAMVEVKSGSIGAVDDSGLSSAKASQIVVSSSLKGKVSNKQASSFTLLDQTITVTANTAYEDYANGFSSLLNGDLVEVHAFEGIAGQYTATRIEHKTGLTECKLTGVVSGLNTTASTFVMGGWNVSYGALGAAVPTLANGMRVRVKLGWDGNNCSIVASRVGNGTFNLSDNTRAEIEGTVTSFTSGASFSVNGTPVTASGSDSAVVAFQGQRVKVEGVMQGGVLVATEVNDKTGSGGGNDVRLFGSPDANSLNTDNSTFTLRGFTVNYSAAQFNGGANVSSLSTGANLEVRGNLDNTGTVIATEIKLKN